jgi:tape measure domain-containing protein
VSRVNISTLNINITASSGGVTQAVQQATQSLRTLQQNVQQQNAGLRAAFANFEKILIRSIALYSTFRAINFARDQLFDAVRLAADAEQASIAFEVLLGSAEDASRTIAGLYDFVETTPFRLDELQTSSKLLAAFGFETDRIIPSLRAIGDIASATGANFTELADVYGRTKVEQRLYTRDLNQFTSRGIPLIEEFAAAFGVAETEIRKMAEAGYLSFDDVERAFASMTSEGGRFFELMELQSQTFEGQVSNLLDEIDALKREFGQGLIPTLKDFVVNMRIAIQEIRNGNSVLGDIVYLGRLAGMSLRLTYASFVLLKIGANEAALKFVYFGSVVEGVFRFLAGQKDRNYFRSLSDELRISIDQMYQDVSRLKNFSVGFAEAFTRGELDGVATLEELLGKVTEASLRANNQLRFMTSDAAEFAKAMRDKYATPLQEFEETASKLIKANLLGEINDSELAFFLSSEVERLNEATQKLKDTLAGPVLERGQRDTIDFINRQKFAPKDQTPIATDAEALIAKLKLELQAEVGKLIGDAEQAKAAERIAELANQAKRASDTLEALADKIGDSEEAQKLYAAVAELKAAIDAEKKALEEASNSTEEMSIATKRATSTVLSFADSLEKAGRKEDAKRLRDSVGGLNNPIAPPGATGGSSGPVVFDEEAYAKRLRDSVGGLNNPIAPPCATGGSSGPVVFDEEADRRRRQRIDYKVRIATDPAFAESEQAKKEATTGVKGAINAAKGAVSAIQKGVDAYLSGTRQAVDALDPDKPVLGPLDPNSPRGKEEAERKAQREGYAEEARQYAADAKAAAEAASEQAMQTLAERDEAIRAQTGDSSLTIDDIVSQRNAERPPAAPSADLQAKSDEMRAKFNETYNELDAALQENKGRLERGIYGKDPVKPSQQQQNFTNQLNELRANAAAFSASPEESVKAAMNKFRNDREGKDVAPQAPGIAAALLAELQAQSAGVTPDAAAKATREGNAEAQLSELMHLLKQSYSSREIAGGQPADMMAKQAMEYFRRDRQEQLDAGFEVDKQAPGLYQELLKIIQNEQQLGSASAPEPEGGQKTTTKAVEKLQKEITRTNAINQTQLSKIATAMDALVKSGVIRLETVNA